jgi:hypothetical protein
MFRKRSITTFLSSGMVVAALTLAAQPTESEAFRSAVQVDDVGTPA